MTTRPCTRCGSPTTEEDYHILWEIDGCPTEGTQPPHSVHILAMNKRDRDAIERVARVIDGLK